MADMDLDRAEEDAAEWTESRAAMVGTIRAYGVRDPLVLDAMARVRRHRFIPAPFRSRSAAYGDHPSPIGNDQTISQPYIVAYMIESLRLSRGEKVLEIGTGSGYEAAVLAEMGMDVYSVEVIPALSEHARRVLTAEGYDGVHLKVGDGYAGWIACQPFDAIVVSCAPLDVPAALVDQMRDGGRMIAPLGDWAQRLVIVTRQGDRALRREDLAVRFVPMVKASV
jgi:protein-L-isoaspartate(D-aspartate) O-methyltransferase